MNGLVSHVYKEQSIQTDSELYIEFVG